MRRRVFVAAALGVAAVATGAVASADGRSAGFDAGAARLEVLDGRDRPRRPLDVREIDTAPDARFLRFTISTWSRWGRAAIRDRGYLFVHLDTLPAPGFEHYVLVRSSRRRVVASVFSARRRRDRRIAGATVWRRDRRSVALRVSRRRVGLAGPAPAYSWYAQTLFTNRRCKRVCFDRAPETGAVVEPLPAPPP